MIGVCGSARYVYPALEVVGEVPASFIVQMMLTFNWYLITFVKFVICYYAFNFGLGQLGLKSNSIVIPVGVIITAFSVYIYQNTIEETYSLRIFGLYIVFLWNMEYLFTLGTDKNTGVKNRLPFPNLKNLIKYLYFIVCWESGSNMVEEIL